MINSRKDFNQSRTEEYQRFSKLLEGIEQFARKHQVLSYIEFDYYVVHDMTLFSIEPDFDFKKLENMIYYIKKATPAIKRIFSKPIIVLKDTDDVLPVENTRIINHNTLLHIANHGQYVSNITNKGVKPRKLLTRIYEDDYGIYENIIFCNIIDDIISWIKKNRRTLNTLLYASDIMKFNLLEKVNHLNYFLALGKLHTGYIRDFSQYFTLSKELLSEMAFISQTINSRLSKPVYQKNIVRNRHLPLKKTNIFMMQKDYRNVYRTYKYFLGNQTKDEVNEAAIDFDAMRRNYMMYVQILIIFSAGHFNFEMDSRAKINLSSLDVTFTFRDWKLDVFSNNKKEILIYFTKEKTHKIMIVEGDFDIKVFNSYKKNYGVSEVVTVNQFDENYLERDDVYISLEDVDSFRRIQQILLKGMIYSDTKRDICPFCGGKLHKIPNQEIHQCNDCMTQIGEVKCIDTRKTFFYTDNAHQRKYSIHKSDFKQDSYWYYNKQVESAMYFRNITKINQNSEIICPYCNKIHKN